MLKLRHRAGLPIWIALLAIWALSLVPTVSQLRAAASPDGSLHAEICTPQGLRLVSLVSPGDPAGAPAAEHTDHCPLCRLQHDAPPLPVPTAPLLENLPSPAFEPTLRLQVPRALHAWCSAQPRAPPILT